MFYPRTFRINGKEVLVDETQMISYREHLNFHCRMLFISGVITGEVEMHNTLMAFDTISHDPIILVITSAGGDLDSTFLFYDTMKLVKSPIITVGRYCASAAALLLAAGKKRYLFPHAKVMLHLLTGSTIGDSHDLDIQHAELCKYRNKVIDILAECGVKKSREEILSDIDRNFWLEPQEAIDYGLADSIMDKETWQKWTGKGELDGRISKSRLTPDIDLHSCPAEPNND